MNSDKNIIKHRGEAVLRNTRANRIQVMNSIIQSLDNLNGNTDFQPAVAVSRAGDFGSKSSRFAPRTLPPLRSKSLRAGTDRERQQMAVMEPPLCTCKEEATEIFRTSVGRKEHLSQKRTPFIQVILSPLKTFQIY